MLFRSDESQLSVEDIGAALCATGAGHVLLLGSPGGVQVVHVLHGASGVVRRDVFERAAVPVLGLASSASAALAASLAEGLDVPAAVQVALRCAHAAEGRHFRLGMGTAVPGRGARK